MDAYMDSCRLQGRVAVLFKLVSAVPLEDAFRMRRCIPWLVVRRDTKNVDVHTDSQRTPSSGYNFRLTPTLAADS